MAAQLTADDKEDEWIEVETSEADEHVHLKLAPAGDVSGEWDQVLVKDARVATYASVLSHNLEGVTPVGGLHLPRPVGLIKRPKRQVGSSALNRSTHSTLLPRLTSPLLSP